MSKNLPSSLKNSSAKNAPNNTYGPYTLISPSSKSSRKNRRSLYTISSLDPSSQDSKFKLNLNFTFLNSLSKREKTEDEEASQAMEKQPSKLLPDNENLLKIRIKSDLEKIEEEPEGHLLTDLYQATLRIKYGISDFFRMVVRSILFQVVVNLVIILNTIILALEDPTWDNIPPPYDSFEIFFAYFYTIEFAMLAVAYGLVRYSDSYFRSWWNILDFFIIVTAWLSIYAGSGFRLSALRSLRILRPLKSIRSIKGMKAIFMALVNSIWPLLSALFILFFFIFLFAIIAVQLWMDELKGKCLTIETGLIKNPSYNCGSSTCFTGEECVKTLDNPNFGVSHYDNIFMAMITVFQIITLEGWTNNLVTLQTAFSYWSVLYFMPLIFITSYLIMNYTMAIIAISFKNTAQDIFQKTEKNDKVSLSEGMIEEILKNTINYNLKTTEKSTGDENRGTERETGVGEFTVKVQDWSKGEAHEYTTENKENLEENKSSEVSEEGLITFSDFIDENSAFSKKTTVTKKTGIQGIEEKLSRQPLSSMLKNFQSNLETYQNLTSIQQDLESLQKQKEGLKKIAINNKKFHILLKDPQKVKNAILVLQKNLKLESTSSRSILLQSKTNIVPDFEYSYKDPRESKVLLYSHLTVYKPMKKFSEFDNIFSMFKYFSIRTSQKKAFFKTNPNVKSIVSKSFLENEGNWSGFDVQINEDSKNNESFKALSGMSYSVWSKGVLGLLEKIQYPLKYVITHKYTNNIMLLSVIVNTVVLSLERYGISQSEEDTLQQINTSFTYLFAAEIFLKIISLGLVSFIRDLMNVFDTIVVILSLVEIFILNSGTNALIAFRAIRVFRIFRVLRVLRIFRYLDSMAVIITSIAKSLSNIAYLFLLLILFQIIFTLLGMQVYGGTFDFNGGVPRGNFDSFHWAFVTTFQLLSVENWNDILTSSLRSNLGQASCLLLFTWIILGNFILLNLFLAILLDSFDGDDEEEDLVIEKEIKLEIKIKNKLEDIQAELDDNSEDLDVNRLRLKTTELHHLECERSYYIFSKDNVIRRACHKIYTSSYFEYIMIIFILLNSIKLVVDTYIMNDPITSLEIKISNYFDIFFTVIFDLEFIIKSISIGFVLSKDSYLRDNWNRLDFCIVIISTIDLALTSISLSVIKIFRVLRTLRPLKLIKHNTSLKVIVMALFESIGAIINVMFLILIVWIIFAILGVSLLSGKMHSCSFQSITDMDTCLSSGYDWVEGRFNFDNVLEAMVVLYIVMSQESWPNRMLEGVDARGVGLSPVTNYNPYMAYYYIIYLFVSNFFLLNLFTVIVFNKFNEAKKNESNLTSLLMFKEQILWSDIQNLIIKAKPWHLKSKINNRFRSFFHQISKSKKLEIIMIGFILVNMIVLAMPYQEASSSYFSALDYINLICTVAFILEAVIKIIGLGFHYFKNNWNKFDFIIVLFSTTDFILSYTASTSFKLLRQAPQLIRVLRIFRVFRLIRLVKQVQTLEKLFIIMAYSLPAILNVLALLMLIFFIYAVLGCFLYSDVPANIGITDWYNFSNFHNAMNILWRISSGEDYPSIMADTVIYQHSYWNILYFTSFVTIIDFIVLELFITITLQYFEEFYMNPYNAVSLFGDDLKVFKKYWTEEIQRYSYKIDKKGLARLMKNLGTRFKFLGVSDNKMNIIRLIEALNIYRDEKGFYYFNDVLYGVLRRKYEKKINKKHYKLDFTIMKMEEIKTKSILKKIRTGYDLKEKKDSIEGIGKDSGYYDYLNLKNVFNSWKNYASDSARYNREKTPPFSENDYPGEKSLLNE